MSEVISASILLMILLGYSAIAGSQGDDVSVLSLQDGQSQSTQGLSIDPNSTFVTDFPLYDYQRGVAKVNGGIRRQDGKKLEHVVFQLLQEGNATKMQDSDEDSDTSDDTDPLTDEMKEVLVNKSNMANISQIITYSDGENINIKDFKITEEDRKVSNTVNISEAASQTISLGNIICSELLSVEMKTSRLFGNGSLLSLDDNLVYPPGYFWKTSNGSYRGCYCSLRPCVMKCCPDGQILSLEMEKCEPSDFEILYPFSPNYTDTPEYIPRLIYGIPCKESMYMLDPQLDDNDKYYLYSNGSLYAEFEDKFFKSTDFCLDVSGEGERILPSLCSSSDEVISQPERGIHYAIGMIICIPFLAATFVAYALLPELRTLHGKCLMCHIGCNLVGYVSLVVIQIWQNDFPDTTCTVFGMVAFFVNLTSFTWLSAMCFDIWWTFSNFLPSRDGIKQERKKFIFYSAYSWGIPTLILIICIIMDFAPGIPEHYIKPEFGKLKCWLSTPEAWLAYFFGPIIILMLCNIVLFIVTAVKIQRIKKETSVLKNNESKRHKEEKKQKSKLYFNLFIVMGISRMAVMIAWAILITMKLTGVIYMWIIIHILEVGMCIIFIGKRQFWTRLIQAMTCCKYFSKSKISSRQESGSSNSTTITVETNEGTIEMRKISSSSTKSGET